MTFEEFKKACVEASEAFSKEESERSRYYEDRGGHDAGNAYIDGKVVPDVMYVEWSTGGVSGGSCWEDSDPRPYTTDANYYSIPAVRGLLKAALPGISFLDYYDIQKMEIYDSWSNYEYYGNSTDRCIRYIPMRNLYDFLVERGL